MIKINRLLPLSLLMSAPLLAAQGDQIGSSRYSISTHNAHALNGVNIASVNAHIEPTTTFSYLTTLRVGGEFGEADFIDDIEDLIDELDRDDVTLDQANSLIDRFNDVLADAGEQGYVDINLGVETPISLLWKREKDAFSLSSRAYGMVHVEILDDKLQYNPIQQTLETNSAGYVKVADMAELSLGYSRLVWEPTYGDLHLGARVNIQQLGLSKQVIGFQSADGDDDLGDIFIDDYKDFRNVTTEVAIDLSAYWSAENYNVGFTLSNINEPEFDYGQLGNNCTAVENNTSRSNCFTALAFSNRIDLTETHTANSYGTFQANYINDAKTFSLDLSLESEHVTPIGKSEEWMTASISYEPETVFVPNTRLTYSNNLSGTELKYLSGEVTWGWLGLGAGYALDETTIDDKETPRGAFFSLSLSNKF